MNKYSIIIQYSSEDNQFIAKALELSGCVVHGETKELALEKLEIAIVNWLEMAEENNLSIPSPVHVNLDLNIDEALSFEEIEPITIDFDNNNDQNWVSPLSYVEKAKLKRGITIRERLRGKL